MTTVGYQGEPGAYSEEAVHLLFPGATAEPRRTLREIFADLRSGQLTHAVVPLENSQAGSINETYDLLAEGDLFVVGEAVISVDHALVALPGTRLEEVHRVTSHPQALAQCQEFLATLGAEVVPVYDTAGAARRIAEDRREGEAAVASRRAAELYGLEILAKGIHDSSLNFTRFAAVAADPEPLGSPDKTSIVFGTAHAPGALYRSLRPFAERGLNLTKLESRPLADAPWQYRFYLDVEAGSGDLALAEALEELGRDAQFVRVLGSYPRWRDRAGEGAEG